MIGGVLKGVVSGFEKEVDEHLRQKKLRIKERGYKRTPEVTGHKQFAWTVCYQVLGMKLPDVAQEFNHPLKTVEAGINRTPALLGLKKRPRSKPGRRPGSVGRARRLSLREEINKKSRLKKFIEACESVKDPDIKAAVARKIGVSEQYFRRAWIPYLLGITGCADYETLIRRDTIDAIKSRNSELLRA